MKLFIVALLCLPSFSVISAQQSGGPEPGTKTNEIAGSSADSIPPWSVVGTWQGVHRHWARPVTISADGRYYVDYGDHKDHGSWKLTTEAGHVNLVLNWDGWDPETITLVGQDEFSGRVPTGTLTLRRTPAKLSNNSPVPPQAATGPSSTPAPVPAQAASPCGSWIWQHDETLTMINADGSVGHKGDQGTWHWLDQPARKLQIDWKSGFVDTLTIAADGKTMNVTNNADDEFTVRRIAQVSDEP